MLPLLFLAQMLLDPLATVRAPASLEEQRAIVALQRTDEGRDLASRFICGDETRYHHILDLDERYARATGLFASRFGHGWRQDAGERAQLSRDDVGRRDDCRLRDSFSAGIVEYENGLLAAQAQLGSAIASDVSEPR